MGYLDFERLDALDAVGFQSQKPYPWLNPEALIHEDGYRRLVETLPDVSLFEGDFGVERKFGQQSHDRYNLEFREDLEISPAWREFVNELKSERYRGFLERLYGRGRFALRFHWHYTPRGCSVSPHCDSRRKLGSHIFFMNREEDWDPSWGGGTVILDDGGRFSRKSNPGFGDFDCRTTANCVGNRSFLFRRVANSWHGVEEIRCPEDLLRKAFIVVVDDRSPIRRLLSGSRRKAVESY